MKKNNRIHVFWVLLLIVFDEFMKFYIIYIKKAELDVCEGTGQLIHFHPTYNEAGSALSLKTGLEFSHFAFMLIAVLASVVIIRIWLWYKRQLDAYNKSTWLLAGFEILLAGTIGRVVERTFWKYTLDYIAIKGFAICDLLDLYLFFGAISILPVVIYVDMKKAQNKKLKVGGHKEK